MSGLWKAVAEYPFDERGCGPLVMISFVRDGGRTTRMAHATKNGDGIVRWHCSEPLPAQSTPDIWLDRGSGSAAPDYASAIARKVEELTGVWPPRPKIRTE
jgi:hypothetical protein